MSVRLPAVNGRREAILVALAAAEISWAAPVVLVLTWQTRRHAPLLLWLGMLVLLLGFSYLYRALARAELSLRVQQGLLVLVLLLSIGLFLRFHLYADSGLRAGAWLLESLRRLTDLTGSAINDLIAVFTLIYLWMRGILLARRSLSIEAVGFSFRAGVLLLVWFALFSGLFLEIDISAFIAPFFFFGLLAVALARIEEVSRVPGSDRAPGSGFWIGSAIVAVALVVLLGLLVATFFSTGPLEQVLRFLSPLLYVLELVLIVLVALVVGLVEFVLSIIPFDLSHIQVWMQQMLEGLQLSAEPLPVSTPQAAEPPPIWGAIQAGVIAAIGVSIVALVLLFTWWRIHRDDGEGVGESRESLLSADALARSLLDMLRSGRDRLSQMAGLVERFGLGSRLLSAISIRRIYANLVRLATRAGYPRLGAQTPYEYLAVLCEAWPEGREDMTAITEAYVNAHYGQVPDSSAELDRIRASWERVRLRLAKS